MNKIFDDFKRSQESGVRSQEEEEEEGGKITHNCANIIYCESLH